MQQCISQLGVVVLLLSNLLNANTPAAPQTLEVKEPAQAVVSSTAIQATVTKYSAIESCHYKNCVMASGKRVYIGAAACPKKYKLGTKVKIGEGTYTCEDRTADWVQQRNGPTFDIFAGFDQAAHEEALKWGRQQITISIID